MACRSRGWIVRLLTCVAVVVVGGTAVAQEAPPAETEVSLGAANRVERLPQGSVGATTFTGAATITYPLEVPPGRGGIRPRIALVYSSDRREEGPFGEGWSLELPRIERRTRGLTYTDQDTFVFSGSELIACSSACGGSSEPNEYRERVGTDPLRRFFRDDGHWTMVDAVGTKYHFGVTVAARQQDAAGERVFSWVLERTEDLSGNVVVYEHVQDSTGSGTLVYPKEIRWTLKAARSSSAEVPALIGEPSVRVVFELGDSATPRTVYRGRLAASARKRVTGVVVSAFTPTGWQPVTKYAFHYEAGRLEAVRRLGVAPGYTGQPFGTCGPLQATDETGCEAEPPTRFSYAPETQHAPSFWRTDAAADRKFNIVGDFDGDGGADIANTAGDSWAISRYDGHGGFVEQLWSNGGRTASNGTLPEGPMVGDVNGDGAADIVVPSSGGFGLSLSQRSGSFASSSWPMTVLPLQAPRVGDFDGDGRADVAYAGGSPARWVVAASTGSGFAASYWSTEGVSVYDVASPPLVLTGDFNGDGLADLMTVKDTVWRLHGSTGSSFVSALWADMTDANMPGKWLVLDANGDGLADVARVRAGTLVDYCPYYGDAGCEPDPETCVAVDLGGDNLCWRDAYQGASCGRAADYAGCYDLASGIDGYKTWTGLTVSVWVSTGNGFSFQGSARRETSVQSGVHAFAGDIEGDGTSEVVVVNRNYWWVADARGVRTSQGFPAPVSGTVSIDCVATVGDFNRTGRTDVAVACPQLVSEPPGWHVSGDDGTFPGLLTEVWNDAGGRTSLVYGSSAAVNRSAPSFDAVTNEMPAKPVLAMSTSSTPDPANGSQLVTAGKVSYRYSGGRMAWLDHEFAGFGTVWRDDGTGTEETTFVHQGLLGPLDVKALRGYPSHRQVVGRQTYWGLPLWLESDDFAWEAVGSSGDGTSVVRLSGVTSQRWSGPVASPTQPQDAPFESSRVFAYDSLGRLESVETSGTGAPTARAKYENYLTIGGLRGDARRTVWRPQHISLEGTEGVLLRHSRLTWYEAGAERDGREGLPYTSTALIGAGEVEGPTVTYEYSEDGALRSITAPDGVVSRIWYDGDEPGWNEAIGRVHPARLETEGMSGTKLSSTVSYDYRFGTVASATDLNGTTTAFERDGLGRVRKAWAEAGETLLSAEHWHFSPATAARPFSAGTVTVTDPPAAEWPPLSPPGGGLTPASASYELLSDALGRGVLTSVASPDPATAYVNASHYDAAGRLVFSDGPFATAAPGSPTYLVPPAGARPWSTALFDSYGRLNAVAGGDPELQHAPCYGVLACREAAANALFVGTKSEFDYVDRSTASRVVGGRSSSVTLDHLGGITRVVEGSGEAPSTSYDWDAAGQLLSVTDSTGRTVLDFGYDLLGRTIWVADPDAGVVVRDATGDVDVDQSRLWRTVYDSATARVDYTETPKGSRRWYEYDEFGRVRAECVGASRLTCETKVTFGFDGAERGLGRLSSVTDGLTTRKILAYDALGRPERTSVVVNETGEEFVTSSVIDGLGRTRSLTYPDGFKVSYEYYGATDYLSSLWSEDGTISAEFSLYEPTGGVGLIELGNGVSTRYTYDPWSGMLTGIVTAPPSASGLPKDDILNESLTQDKSGDVRQITDYRLGGRLGVASVDWSYEYDPLGRLKSESAAIPGGALPGDLSVASFLSFLRHPVMPHALDSTSTPAAAYAFGHDLHGNVESMYDVSNPGNPIAVELGWDDEDRIVSVRRRGTEVARFDYGAGEQRLRKLVGTPATRSILYVGPHFEVTKSGGSTVTTRYVFAGGVRLAVSSGGVVRYLHKDYRGSTIAATDEVGVPVWSCSYSPYGVIRTESGGRPTNYLFTDYEIDPETGLYYAGARYYEPTLGRFLSPDSIVPRLFDPQALNRYAYARNNPMSRVDPDGHEDFRFTIPLNTGGYSSPWLNPVSPSTPGRPFNPYAGSPSYLTNSSPRAPQVYRPPPAPSPSESVTASQLAADIERAMANQIAYRQVVRSDHRTTMGPSLSDTSVQDAWLAHRLSGGILDFGSGLGWAWGNPSLSSGQKVLAAAPDLFMIGSLRGLVSRRIIRALGGVGDDLVAHELAGGHLLAKHVGLTESALDARLLADPRLRMASTFATEAESQAAAISVLMRERRAIRAWLKTGATEHVVEGPFSGGLVRLPGGYSLPGAGARFVLRRTSGGGFYIHTGYPTP